MRKVLAVLCSLLVYATQAQIKNYPALQSFEEPFATGHNVGFLPDWWGNFMVTDTIGQYTGFAKSGNASLYMLPEGEEFKTIVRARLDLTNAYHTYVEFWVATRKNGSFEDEKRVKLNVAISLDGGATYPFVKGIGPHEGFPNADTEFQKFTFVFPPATNNQPNVMLRFLSKSGGGPHEPGLLLIDDVTIAQAASDIFPPYIMGDELTIFALDQLKIPLSEPVNEASANIDNYKFLWPEDEHGSYIPGEGPLPKVIGVTRNSNGYSINLLLSPALSVGESYNLEILNLTDLNGNSTAILSLDGIVYNVPAPGSLVFSEILFNDPSSVNPKQKLQYVEIYNPTSEVVPLGGLRVKGAIAAHDLPNIKLKPGEYWVMTRNAESYYSTFRKRAWEWKGSWIEYVSHEGESVGPQSLYIQTTNRHNGKLVDSIGFDFSDARWAALNKAGYSIEICNPFSDKLNPENWSLSNDNRVSYKYFINGVKYNIYATPVDHCYVPLKELVAYCTYSHGFYGNDSGSACTFDNSRMPSFDIMNNALPISDKQIFGLLSNNRYFTLKGADIYSGAIYNMLPGSKPPAPIKYTGGATYSMPSTWPVVPLNSVNGKIENILLSQSIALYFNMSVKSGPYSLANFTLRPVILTAKSSDCGNSISIPKQYEFVYISTRILKYLHENYSDGAKVSNLFKLANRMLGGDPSLVTFNTLGRPTYKSITAHEIARAVEAVNIIFEKCRVYIPDTRLLCYATHRTSEIEDEMTEINFETEVVKESVQIYPNPFVGQTTIRIYSEIDTHATLQIFTAEGIELAKLFDGMLVANEAQEITFIPGLSQSGLYMYRFTTGSYVKTGKIQVVK